MTARTAIAELLGAEVDELARLPGGNSLVLQVRAAGTLYAAKIYRADDRDRLGQEFGALQFLWQSGLRCLPRPVAARPADRLAIYGWLDGARVTAPTDDDIAACAAFAGALRARVHHAAAETLPDASAACLTPAAALSQLNDRLARLEAPAEQHPALASLLRAGLQPARDAVATRAQRLLDQAGIAWRAPLPRSRQTLSPSDFGFHNTKRTADGTVCFLDFEYFGWDDPVKMTCDFLLHPGSQLAPAHRGLFLQSARTLFADDPQFEVRLDALGPLYALIWCAIMLNSYLVDDSTPAGQQRRERLTAATSLCERITHGIEHGFVAFATRA